MTSSPRTSAVPSDCNWSPAFIALLPFVAAYTMEGTVKMELFFGGKYKSSNIIRLRWSILTICYIRRISVCANRCISYSLTPYLAVFGGAFRNWLFFDTYILLATKNNETIKKSYLIPHCLHENSWMRS